MSVNKQYLHVCTTVFCIFDWNMIVYVLYNMVWIAHYNPSHFHLRKTTLNSVSKYILSSKYSGVKSGCIFYN